MTCLASICVFCGARSGHNPAYADAARTLDRSLAAHGWRLVYGAGDVGLMSEVARAAQAAGAVTLGVIPAHLLGLDVGNTDVATLVVTETMHERKKVMFMNSDAIVVMPGGAGSLDEFFEVLTRAQIGLHGKPIFLVDVAGYWQPLIDLIDHVIAEGFADPGLRRHFRVAPTVETLAELLEATPPFGNLP